LGNASLGFLCGGGVFLLIIIVSALFRRALFLNPLIRIFIHIATDDDGLEEETDEY